MKRLLGAFAILAIWALPAAPAHAASDPEAYMSTVAGNLGDPGVWVDPAVTELDATEIAELDAAAKSAAAPIRIAVIPAAKINTSDSKYYVNLAWEGEEIADQLYDRVGVEGVYAVLVDADSESDGRGFHAVQRADKGPTYHVGDAVDEAVDCCAPDYEDMLVRFIQRAQQIDKPFYVDAAPYAGGVAGVIGLWYGVTALGARRARRKDEKEHLDVTRPLLNEEVIALSQQVSALPTTSDPQQSKLSKDVLDTVEKARHRLDAAKGDTGRRGGDDTARLGSLRAGVSGCIAGREADSRADGALLLRPAARTQYGTRGVAAGAGQRPRGQCVCGLQAAGRGGEKPQVRMVDQWSDSLRPYWSIGESLSAYIDGYWSQGDGRRWWFPDDDARRTSDQMRARWRSRRPGARFSRWSSDVGSSVSSWSASSSGSGSSWSSGSSRRSSWSSRTRSSGGGSSRRSSRRSGGSRGF